MASVVFYLTGGSSARAAAAAATPIAICYVLPNPKCSVDDSGFSTEFLIQSATVKANIKKRTPPNLKPAVRVVCSDTLCIGNILKRVIQVGKLKPDPTTEELVAWLKLQLENSFRILLVGQSFGGMIAALAAETLVSTGGLQPSELQRLTVVTCGSWYTPSIPHIGQCRHIMYRTDRLGQLFSKAKPDVQNRVIEWHDYAGDVPDEAALDWEWSVPANASESENKFREFVKTLFRKQTEAEDSNSRPGLFKLMLHALKVKKEAKVQKVKTLIYLNSEAYDTMTIIGDYLRKQHHK